MRSFIICGIILFICCNSNAGVFVPQACFVNRFEAHPIIIDESVNIEPKKIRSPFKIKKGMDRIIALRTIDTPEYIFVESNGQRILVEGHGIIKNWIYDIDPLPYINKNNYR